jgi:hypothetical protein
MFRRWFELNLNVELIFRIKILSPNLFFALFAIPLIRRRKLCQSYTSEMEPFILAADIIAGNPTKYY